MMLSLSLATFCRPNYSFAFDCLQHHVHIRHRRNYDKKDSCSGASIINTGTHEYANVTNASQRLR